MATLPTPADLYYQAKSQVRGYGNSQQAALRQSYQNAMGIGMQSLASSGLAGTTIAPSMRMGYMRQYQQSLNALNDQITQSNLGVESTFGLGGIQAQQQATQIANQMTLGKGQLAVSQRNAAVNEKQLQLEKERIALAAQQQNFQQNSYSQSLGGVQNFNSDPFGMWAAAAYQRANSYSPMFPNSGGMFG